MLTRICALFFISLVTISSSVAFGESLPPIQSTPFQILFNQSGTSEIATITADGEPTLVSLAVENPPRIVIDVITKTGKRNKAAKEIILPILNHPCIRQARVGNHTDKIRLVLDLIHTGGKNACPFSIADAPGKVVIDFKHTGNTTPGVVNATVTPTASSTPVAIMSPTARPTATATAIITKTTVIPTPTVTATATNTAKATATNTLVATTKNIPPTQTIAAVTAAPATPTVTVKNSSDAIVIGKPALSAIEFLHQDTTNQIKIILSERVAFKLIREDARRYRISVSDVGLKNRGLLLPQFPPNEVAGFTMARASETASGLDIIIGLDDGMKASAVNIDQAIVVTAEPAGF